MYKNCDSLMRSIKVSNDGLVMYGVKENTPLLKARFLLKERVSNSGILEGTIFLQVFRALYY